MVPVEVKRPSPAPREVSGLQATPKTQQALEKRLEAAVAEDGPDAHEMASEPIATQIVIDEQALLRAKIHEKEMELERQLNAKHCEPLVKLCKQLATSEFFDEAGEAGVTSEDAARFHDLVRQ